MPLTAKTVLGYQGQGQLVWFAHMKVFLDVNDPQLIAFTSDGQLYGSNITVNKEPLVASEHYFEPPYPVNHSIEKCRFTFTYGVMAYTPKKYLISIHIKNKHLTNELTYTTINDTAQSEIGIVQSNGSGTVSRVVDAYPATEIDRELKNNIQVIGNAATEFEIYMSIFGVPYKDGTINVPI